MPSPHWHVGFWRLTVLGWALGSVGAIAFGGTGSHASMPAYTWISPQQKSFLRHSMSGSANLRRSKVAFMVTDVELKKLHQRAEERMLPVGTAAYEIVERALRRRD